MPFDKVETQVDFPAQENAILKFWDEIHAFELLRAKNRGKPRWSFLDGPITANNPMGVHHAWGRTYKDAYQRYFAMLGRDQRYQNGFDCQGLWVEVEVEKELKLRSKRDIENLVEGDRFASIDKFVQLCKDRVNKFARFQTEQSIRLGMWMDWDRTDEDWAKPPDERKSYFTMSAQNNYTIWAFLKKCHERGLVYRGYDAMPWCGRCGVGLSQMEMHEGYVLVAHRSVFVKFPIRAGSVSDGSQTVANASGSDRENLLVWTTTPWTLSSNVAAAVNPQLTYLKVKHKDEIYYCAKGAFTAQRLEEQFKRKEWVAGVPKLSTLEQHFKAKGGYEIVGELPGSALVGWQYAGPFDELEAQNSPSGFPPEVAESFETMPPDESVRDLIPYSPPTKQSAKEIHRVVAWDMVGEAEGTGIVHIAPGCGKEDFQLGKEQGLVPIAPLDDSGTFIAGFGELTGKSALDHATTDWILANLQEKGVLFAVEKYPHNYPHCWRCKTELLFRLVDEWFIDMKWRDEIMAVVEQATFLPEAINGRARELDWLKNMGDWMISKKRFWGLALPIWVCDACGAFDVIGGKDELKQRAASGWEEFEGHSPHRPWIDLVKVKCNCGAAMSRVPDVGNPWLDAGIVPFSTMHYNTNRDQWEKWFPADFITEAFPGQFRNWFYAILAMSTMMVQRPPFKVLLGHAMVRDEHGDEMHKSKGNAIPFEGAAEEGYVIAGKDGKRHPHPPMGADLIRWMFCRQNPAANINFGPGPAQEVRDKFLMKLWNSYAFFCNYARLDGFDPNEARLPFRERPDIDRWILSDLQLLVAASRKAFEAFDVMTFCLETERFVDDKLSNWYIRRNRRRFWKSEQGTDKLAAYQTLYQVLTTLTKLIAPIVPFVAESMWQNMRRETDTQSIHLCEFPEVRSELLEPELSQHMDDLLGLVSLGLAARSAAGHKIRQPLAEIRVDPNSLTELEAVVRFEAQLREELNVKNVSIHIPAEKLELLKDAKQRYGSVVDLTPHIAGHRMLRSTVQLNPRTAKAKYKGKPEPAAAALATMSGTTVLEKMGLTGVYNLLGVDLGPDDLVFGWVGPDGWAGLASRKTGSQVMIDTRITDELAREGMAREVVRHVQSCRKEAGLNMEDRIALYLGAGGKLRDAIAEHNVYILTETLVMDPWETPLGGGAFHAEVKVEGQPLVIELRRI